MRLETLADQLSDAECADLTGGLGPWMTTPVPRLGVPSAKTSDGMVGVRGERFVGTSSTCFPCGTALGATWDPDLVRRVGNALADEAGRKQVAVLLAPVLNLHRHPLAGRNFESFSEDPLLAARLGVGYIRGVQELGVAAVAKHFVANDAEVDRERVEARVDESTLREVYLAPFEAAVREALSRRPRRSWLKRRRPPSGLSWSASRWPVMPRAGRPPAATRACGSPRCWPSPLSETRS